MNTSECLDMYICRAIRLTWIMSSISLDCENTRMRCPDRCRWPASSHSTLSLTDPYIQAKQNKSNIRSYETDKHRLQIP